MNESQSWRKFAPSRISLVNMSKVLHLPETCETVTVPSSSHLRVVFSLCSMTITFRGQVVAPLHTRFIVIVEWSGYVSVVDRVTERLEMEDHIP
jgi:hypothetical protein